MKKEGPGFVYRDGMIADKDYVNWLSEVKHRFQQSQLKAAVRVNTAMLEFYWSIGRDIVQMEVESKWGSGFFNQLSLDMKALFPNETGFSSTNLKYMKRWYLFYNEGIIIRQQAADEFKIDAHKHQTTDQMMTPKKGLRPADLLEMPELRGVFLQHGVEGLCVYSSESVAGRQRWPRAGVWQISANGHHRLGREESVKQAREVLEFRTKM